MPSLYPPLPCTLSPFTSVWWPTTQTTAYKPSETSQSLSNNGSFRQRLKIKQSNQGSVKRGVCGLGWVDLSLK